MSDYRLVIGMLVAGLINLRQTDRKSQSRTSLKKEVVTADRARSRPAGIPRAGTQPRFLALGTVGWILGKERKRRLVKYGEQAGEKGSNFLKGNNKL